MVNDSFLAQFQPNPPCEVIWPGRAARLHLHGSSGAIDLLVAYFHTGNEVREADFHDVHPDWFVIDVTVSLNSGCTFVTALHKGVAPIITL